MINSGFGGGENYAYELTTLYNELRIAGLCWMEFQISFYDLDSKQAINELIKKINITREDVVHFAKNIKDNPFYFTQQFIGGIEMERLMLDYKRNNGEPISMREFHIKIHDEGSIPISQLRKMLLN